MNEELKILAVIGARAGSKGVPNKNIRSLAGKPLMSWIIETAKSSHYVNRIIVSTDSEKYAQIARKYGAETPYMRPSRFANDISPEFEYVIDLLKWLNEKENYKPDIIVRLLPTVPLQKPEDIDLCVETLLKDPTAHSSVVIAEARQHPQKALKLIDDGKGGEYLVTYFSESGREVTPIARQNYAKAYFRGNIIVSRYDTIFSTHSLTGDRVRFYKIPQERSVDIDNELDFIIIEQLMKIL